MATWNRNVDDEGDYLVVTKTAQNADPPPVPAHDPRTDTALDITTYTADRAPDGAMIIYHPSPREGVTLLGITMKDQKPVPPELTWRFDGPLLKLTDKGAAGTDYEYYVWGTVGTVDKRTEDPQIHNL